MLVTSFYGSNIRCFSLKTKDRNPVSEIFVINYTFLELQSCEIDSIGTVSDDELH